MGRFGGRWQYAAEALWSAYCANMVYFATILVLPTNLDHIWNYMLFRLCTDWGAAQFLSWVYKRDTGEELPPEFRKFVKVF